MATQTHHQNELKGPRFVTFQFGDTRITVVWCIAIKGKLAAFKFSPERSW
ncbi:MAG: hypothetical protein M3440_11555 [Chloroflexota bacterium]|nr:hypothetical protein [Chloroflexota bacterium]